MVLDMVLVLVLVSIAFAVRSVCVRMLIYLFMSGICAFNCFFVLILGL